MRAYKDKAELKNEIHQSFEKYISEFDTIPEALKDKRVPGCGQNAGRESCVSGGMDDTALKMGD